MFPFLSDHGILGLNARSLLYIRPFNPKKAVAFADDKLKTKAFLAARGIPVAKMYGRIETREQLRNFDFSQLPDSCVLKPNFGFGGEGIMVLKGRTKGGAFLRQTKKGSVPMSIPEITEHIEDIIDGKFSVNGRMDTAFFEQILEADTCFAPFRPVGLPDIRVIVFNLVPVMAMLRIPTRESEGKANVHLGGLGIGIDIAKGTTTHAAQYNSIIEELPHGGSPSGIPIPYWDDILRICSQIQQITNIGYLAVDITIDKTMGPSLLEVNARAGLMVQLANLAPLRARLKRVKGISVSSPEKGVLLGKELFGTESKSRDDAPATPSKPILGTHDVLEISGDGTTTQIPCTIAPDEERTLFSASLIKELCKAGALEKADSTEGLYRAKFLLGGQKIQTLIAKGSLPKGVQAVIGKRDLSGFLIDPTKERCQTIKPTSSTKKDLRAVDNLLSQIDRELLPLKLLKPTNLAEERIRLLEDRKYNPVFTLPTIEADLDEAKKKLDAPITNNSPLGILLEKKRQSLLKRIDLLEKRGKSAAFTKSSKELFGSPTAQLSKEARAVLKERIASELPVSEKELLTAEQVQERFSEVLSQYGLHNWEASVRTRLVADCTVGGTKIYIRSGARFSPIHVQALIAHEIETHVLTAENGDHQPYSLLRTGCSNYLDTQEGLAIFNEYNVLGPHHEKRYASAKGTLAIAYGLKHSFAQTRQYLEEELHYTAEQALKKTLDIKRGLTNTEETGGFTKGLVYFRGVRSIQKFVDDGGDIRRLYIGKVALEDLELIEQIEGLREPLIIPEWLREG